MKLPFSSKKGGQRYNNTQALFDVSGAQVPRESLGRFQEKVDNPAFDHRKHKDESRKTIAYIFVWGYIGIVSFILVGVPVYNLVALNNPQELDLIKILSQAGALLGAPVGFVVGYYFKEDRD